MTKDLFAFRDRKIAQLRTRAKRAEARVTELETEVARLTARKRTTGSDLRCLCGDPIQLRDAVDPSSWIHSPGSDTPCFNARPATA